MDQRSLFGLTEHLEALSRHGDPLEVLDATVDFEYFRGWLVERDGSKGGRPPFDPVSMFKALILQARHNLSDARMEFMPPLPGSGLRANHERGKLVVMDAVPRLRSGRTDAGREHDPAVPGQAHRERGAEAGDKGLRLAPPEEGLHPPLDDCPQSPAGLRMSGQIVDASLVLAPKQRNTDGEKEAIKSGKSAREIWPNEPNKAAQKDTNARWMLKVGGKVRYRPDGTPLPMIAAPVFG